MLLWNRLDGWYPDCLNSVPGRDRSQLSLRYWVTTLTALTDAPIKADMVPMCSWQRAHDACLALAHPVASAQAGKEGYAFILEALKRPWAPTGWSHQSGQHPCMLSSCIPLCCAVSILHHVHLHPLMLCLLWILCTWIPLCCAVSIMYAVHLDPFMLCLLLRQAGAQQHCILGPHTGNWLMHVQPLSICLMGHKSLISAHHPGMTCFLHLPLA